MSLVTELFTGLIGIHAVRHSGGIPGIYFSKKSILKKISGRQNRHTKNFHYANHVVNIAARYGSKLFDTLMVFLPKKIRKVFF